MTDNEYMELALCEALSAAQRGETPVGCVITGPDGKIIGRGSNNTQSGKNPTRHAEMEAIADACRTLDSRYLSGCSLYVTMEPCPMCAGAVMLSRISRVVFGARDKNAGSCGSVINLFMENYGYSPAVRGGILEDRCSFILSSFFSALRSDKE